MLDFKRIGCESAGQVEATKSYLERAVELGRQGCGQTMPNPPVGAVIVRNGEIIGEGWHQLAGTPHAERNALADAARRGKDVRGAEIYVSLEPCSTHGRTGACVDAIIDAGLASCTYAQRDPNPQHVGAADHLLARAGVAVAHVPIESGAELIRGFTMLQTEGRPWVVGKMAMSLDGRISRLPSEGQWLTSPQARERVHELRATVDGIITSGETVRKDDPTLTVRGGAWERRTDIYGEVGRVPVQPWRIIMQRAAPGAIPTDARVLGDDGRLMRHRGQEPHQVLQDLGAKGLTCVMIEAGGKLTGAFHDAGLIDEWWLFLAPCLLAGESSALAGEGAESIAAASRLGEVAFEKIGSDVLMRGLTRR